MRTVLLILCMVTVLVYPISKETSYNKMDLEHNAVPDTILLVKSKNIDTIVFPNRTYQDFEDKLACRESSNNWMAVNQFGYIGKYQFGRLALNDIGMGEITADEFKENPSIFPESKQEEALKLLVTKNKKYLKSFIQKYKNKKVNGVLITESGIIAAAHLVGQGSVKKWLKNKGEINCCDGNGVSIQEYLKNFSGYSI